MKTHKLLAVRSPYQSGTRLVETFSGFELRLLNHDAVDLDCRGDAAITDLGVPRQMYHAPVIPCVGRIHITTTPLPRSVPPLPS